MLNDIEDHHLQLRYHPLLFCNFKCFNIKAGTAHHPLIQKEVDELLVRGIIETLTCGTGFYSNVFLAPKHAGVL